MHKQKSLMFALGFALVLFAGAATVAYAASGINWEEKTDNAAWGDRSGHSSVFAKGKLWVMGGFTPSGGPASNVSNDVWVSGNGISWNQKTASTTWEPRATQGSVVFKNKVWVMGGANSVFHSLNDVWSSPVANGTVWTEVLANAPWESRQGFGLAVFRAPSQQQKMWLVGGGHYEGSGLSVFNDVWSSPDGLTWTEIDADAPWAARRYPGLVALDNKLWVMGGSDQNNTVFNDVWSSSDGVNWTEVTPHAPWPARTGMQVLAARNKIWVIGGISFSGSTITPFNDVWYTEDGVNWTEATPTAPWEPRNGHTSLFAKDKLWVLGGGINNPATMVNDVWSTKINCLPETRGGFNGGCNETSVEIQ